MKVIDKIRTPEEVSAIAVGVGSLWVAGSDGPLLRIDLATAKVVAKIYSGVANIPGGAWEIAIRGTDVWTAVPVGSSPPGGFGPGENPEPFIEPVYDGFRRTEADLYKVETSGGIVRVDARTNEVRGWMLFLDYSPTTIALTETGPWIPDKRGLRRIDPADLSIGPRIAEGAAGSLLVENDELWALAGFKITRIDPASGEKELEITADDRSDESEFIEMARDGDALWVTTSTHILKYDAVSGALMGRVEVGDCWEIAAADGIVLAKSLLGDELIRIDSDTLEVVERLQLPDDQSLGSGLVIHRGEAWVAHDYRVLRVFLG